MLLNLGCAVVGALVALVLARVFGKHPVSTGDARRRGLVRCILCEGAGYYRDVTTEHLAERAERLGAGEPPC